MENEIETELDSLIDKLGDLLDNKSMYAAHIAVAKFFVQISYESGNGKDTFLSLCSDLWDSMEKSYQAEVTH